MTAVKENRPAVSTYSSHVVSCATIHAQNVSYAKDLSTYSTQGPYQKSSIYTETSLLQHGIRNSCKQMICLLLALFKLLSTKH